MRYFFVKEEVEERLPAAYYELDKEWYIIRSVIVLPDSLVGSNKPYYNIPGEDDYELTIPEGPHDPQDLMPGYEEMILEIEQEEFDKKWKECLDSNISPWNDTKSAFNIGDRIEGRPKMYVPQGILVEINEDVFGILPKEKENTTISIGQSNLAVEVISYEENFHWLGLKMIEKRNNR